MMQKLKARMTMGRQGWYRSLPLGDDGVCQVTIVGLGATSHVLLGMFGLMPDDAPLRLNVLNICPNTSSQELMNNFKEHGGVVLHHVNDQDRQKVHLAFPDSILPGKLGVPHKISNDPADVIPGSQLVLFAQSTECDLEVLSRLKGHLEEDVWLGHFASRGFEDVVFAKAIGSDLALDKMTIFGLSDCPWLSEIEEPGRSVRIFGTFREVGVACRPNSTKSAVATVVQGIIDPSEELCKVVTDHSFLGVTLGVVGFSTVFTQAAERNWKQIEGDPAIVKNFIDYEACGKLMELSSEIQLVTKTLCDRYPKLDLQGSKHLIDWWSLKFDEQARDPATFARVFKTNPTFANLRVKDLKKSSGREIDYQSGFMKEEVRNSLMPIKGLGEFLGVETPTLDALILWAQDKLQEEYIVPSKVPVGGMQELSVKSPSSPTESQRPVISSEKIRQYICNGKDLHSTRAPQAFGAKTVEDFLVNNYYLHGKGQQQQQQQQQPLVHGVM